MKWYWKVRLHRDDGHYAHACVETSRDLEAINIIQDFYRSLTGCKMLLEGMSEEPFDTLKLEVAFVRLWLPSK